MTSSRSSIGTSNVNTSPSSRRAWNRNGSGRRPNRASWTGAGSGMTGGATSGTPSTGPAVEGANEPISGSSVERATVEASSRVMTPKGKPLQNKCHG